MEDITTKNDIIMGLEQQYIKKGPFLNSETKKQEIWLHNLPENEELFNIIELLREEYDSEDFIFIINQKIEIKEITIAKNINFFNFIFKYEVCFEDGIYLQFPSIHFYKTIFNGNINFFYSKLYQANFENIDLQGNTYNIFAYCSLEKVKFHNVIFRGNIQFDHSEMKDVSFKNCTFKGKTDFRDVSFKGKSEFLNCTFDSSENHTIKKVNFSGCTFEQEANFSGSIFNLKADFSKTIFGTKKENNNSHESSSEVKFLIENAKFQKEVDFSKAIFYDLIYFSETEFCTDIKDYAKKSINFENAQFKRKVRFHHCKFYNTVRFENTSFNKLVDFYCAHFYKPQQFHFTDFLDRAIFSNTEFNEEVQFLHCRVDSNSYIRFESATFKKSLDISRSNFNDKANFWNIELEEGDILTSSKYQDDFEVHKNEINSEKTVPSIYKQLRETYRIIKSNFYSQNNKIEGLKFYEKEMSVYLEEKREETNEKSPPKNKKTFIEKFREKFIEEPILNIGLLLVSISTFLWAILKCPIFYIASVIFTSLIILGIVIKNKESLKYRNPIKQNYYMPIILLVIATVLIYIYIYNIENPWYIISAYIVLLCGMLLLYFSIEKDKIILWFNKNSNEFDTNWVVGVNFSLLVGTLTYLIVLLSMFIFTDLTIDNINSSIFLTSLVDVFNITKWDNLEIIGVKLKDLSYLLLFIGRIFIGYGYYQTIQAFRKFGKS